MEIDEKKVATIFKAFCDENRIRILQQLLTGEKCACVLLDNLQITQPTLSHHMKILCDADIVISRKEGKWTHYSISKSGGAYAAECLKTLTNTSLSDNR
ncbi:metalloregulator ArsR/SmtB family transcription factor [Lachnospiraceae bacterium 29-91]